MLFKVYSTLFLCNCLINFVAFNKLAVCLSTQDLLGCSDNGSGHVQTMAVDMFTCIHRLLAMSIQPT